MALLAEGPLRQRRAFSDVLVMPPQNGFTCWPLMQGKHLRRSIGDDFCEHRSQEFRRRCHAVTQPVYAPPAFIGGRT